MKLLLDTHILLWAAGGSKQLSDKAVSLLKNPENELLFSVTSLWEIIIKHGLGREDFQVDVHVLRRGLLDNGYSELPILSEHVMTIAGLPAIHKDPFDRALIAQAIAEGVTLLTADSLVAQYPGPILTV
jgi:PIN domain nuclease of toxin-antitoxin system